MDTERTQRHSPAVTMADPKITSFEEFWDYYVGEHAKPATRAFHVAGTAAALACVAGGLLTGRRGLLLLAPLCGYGPAWFSHFFIEKNRPATFTYPLWSLKADFVMFGKVLTGQMQAEVDRVMRSKGAGHEAPASVSSGLHSAAN